MMFEISQSFISAMRMYHLLLDCNRGKISTHNKKIKLVLFAKWTCSIKIALLSER